MRILLILLFVVSAVTSYSQKNDLKKFGVLEGTQKQGVLVGEKAPGFISKDQNGKEVKLKELLKKGPLVVVFYRGNWCPYCQRYLASLSDSASMIEKKGGKLIAITPEGAKGVEKTKVADGISLISDESGKIMKAYKLDFQLTDGYKAKVKKYLNVEMDELVVPATYVIDQSGKVVYRHFDYNYTKRASVQELLQHL